MEEQQFSKGEQTRQNILAAAKGLFLAQGYAATTMRKVARAVGITPAVIYNYFPGKDALFASLLQATAPVEHLFAQIRELEADTAEALLQQAFRSAIEIFSRHEDYFRLALIDAQERGGATLTSFVPKVLPHALELHQRLVALDAAGGRLRDVPYFVFLRAQISLIAGWMFTKRVVESAKALLRLPDVDWAQALADVFLHGVLNPPGSSGG